MPFTFPDPQTTPEFTGDNGITYIWDADDSKWQIKGFAVEQSEDFDPQLKEHVCAEFFEVVADYQTVETTKGHSMATYNFGDPGVKYWTKPPKAGFFVNGESYYIDEAGPFELEQVDATAKWVTFFIKGGYEPAVGEFCTFSKTRKLCTEVAFLQNEIIELEEEINAIAPSVERGQFISTTYSNAPRDGEFMLSTLAGKTIDYGDPGIVLIQISKVDNEGVAHTYADVEEGQLLQLFEDGNSDYGLYLIEAVAGQDDAAMTAVTFTVSPVSGFGEATEGDLARLKIFSAPSGGTADGFVLKTGDTMEGPSPLVFKTKETTHDYNKPPTNGPYLKFLNDKNGTINSVNLWLGDNTNTLTTDHNIMARGSIYTKEYYYAYGTSGTNKPRIRLQSSIGSLQSDSTIALKWDSTGVTKLRAKGSEGSSGYVLRLDSSKVPYWSSPPMPTYTITKSNGNYYVS